MIRPDISKLPREVKDYIEYMEQKVDDYEAPGFNGMFYALQRKYNQMSRDINETELKLSGDDKSWDRFMKLTANLKDLSLQVEWLGQKIGLEKPEEEKKNENPVEKRANERSKVR